MIKRTTKLLNNNIGKNFYSTKQKGSKILKNFVKLSQTGNKSELEKYGFHLEPEKPGYFNFINENDEEDEKSNFNQKFEVFSKANIERIFAIQEKEILQKNPEQIKREFNQHFDEDSEYDVNSLSEKEQETLDSKKIELESGLDQLDLTC
jgi:hypothetical protein